MLLRARRHGLTVLARSNASSSVKTYAALVHYHQLRATATTTTTTTSSAGPQKAPASPDPARATPPLNWSSLAHRTRHTAPSAMAHSHSHARGHAGHSHGHGHGHSHDNTFLVSKNKNDAAVRITRIGLYVNLGMAVSKGIGGYAFHSQALIADAVHSLTDLVSDVMTLATVGWSLKTPSERFPSGYGKVESLGSLGVSGILLGGGFMMGWTALVAICQQFFPGFAEMAANLGLLGHSHHHHGVGDLGPNMNAAWLAGGSILIKEWLYRATLKVAKERNSTVLASNAYHHRVDSLTAFVALLLIAGSNVLNNAAWLDPVGGLVISLMVVQAGWGNTKSALLELADVGVESEMREKVEKAATKALEDITTASDPVTVRYVQGVKAGQNYLMDVELGVPSTWTVEQTRNIENMVRERVGAKVRGVKKVRVRFVANSEDKPDFMDEFITGGVSATEDPSAQEHEHEHENEHTHEQSKSSDSSVRRRN